MHWAHFLSTTFLIFISILLWGTWQGWFSRRLKKSKTDKPTPQPVVDECKGLRELVARLQARIFDLENENAGLRAKILELQKQIEYLMNQINQLTTELEASRQREADLAARLRAALEDLQACRSALQKCKSELLAKKIADATCKLSPENANLLR